MNAGYAAVTSVLFRGSACARSHNASYTLPSDTPSALAKRNSRIKRMTEDNTKTHLSSTQSSKPKASVSPIALDKRPRHAASIARRRLRAESADAAVGAVRNSPKAYSSASAPSTVVRRY